MMRKIPMFLAAAALPAAASMAAPSAATSVAATKPGPANAAPMAVRRSISPEGNAIAKRIMETPDPHMADMRAEAARLADQKLQIARSPNPDIDKLEQVIRREEALKAEAMKIADDRFLGLLRALSVSDRSIVLQNLANPVKLPSAATPPAGAAQPAKPAKGN